MTWLITGGAGYIGAHVVGEFRRAELPVVVLDDLSTGTPERLDPDVPFVHASVTDPDALATTLHEYSVTGIVHLAGKKQVAESVANPLFYYAQNVGGLRVLLEQCSAADVRNFVFSSSASVYGEVAVANVDEATPCNPASPYGRSKLIGEWMIRDVAATTALRYANLRYFNVAGTANVRLADTSVNNLVPMVLQRLTLGQPPRIFGDDYPTRDGTCVRDFIHVSDIASAHVAAAQALLDARVTSLTANIGTGIGVSVAQMVSTILSISGYGDDPALAPVIDPRRPGDPASVVASAQLIEATLGWRATHDVTDMVRSACAAFLDTNSADSADRRQDS